MTKPSKLSNLPFGYIRKGGKIGSKTQEVKAPPIHDLAGEIKRLKDRLQNALERAHCGLDAMSAVSSHSGRLMGLVEAQLALGDVSHYLAETTNLITIGVARLVREECLGNPERDQILRRPSIARR
jgi:hypothetical protein